MERAAIRDLILADPSLVLGDEEVMRAVVAAQADDSGRVTDLRGVLVDRLEGRLGTLEATHRTVIAAAYENLSGAQQVHRAVLELLDPTEFGGFLTAMTGPVADILNVDTVRLALELTEAERTIANAPGLVALPPGGVDSYIGAGWDRDPDRVTLRRVDRTAAAVFEEETLLIQSEALMRLDLGTGRRAAMLVFGAADPERFTPDQATDFLDFFAGCFERAVRRWLA
ncbi:DUF484 family protein [Roseobacter sp. HKCCA0434]|uniref:DUF484 family protein n=1 Tax=Roseobacter sp. HKCCA0434 TaxID=3079297 RepID=UPI002905D099|nr:DUF484 family protein [Roseobacter sp. HKCCA0434]